MLRIIYVCAEARLPPVARTLVFFACQPDLHAVPMPRKESVVVFPQHCLGTEAFDLAHQ